MTKKHTILTSTLSLVFMGTWSAAAELKGPADLGMELVAIPAGTFQMGSSDSEPWRNADPATGEGPVTKVTLTQAFWLAKTETTRGQYEALMGPTEDPWSKKLAEEIRKGGADVAKFPIVNITWDQANTFCQKLTERERTAGRLPAGLIYSLPTEAQWEYACRAGTTTRN